MPDVRFGRDVRGGSHEHLFDRQPLDLHAEDLAGDLARFLGGLGELHAARLAAAAGVHLRLDHHRAAELARDRLGLGGGRRDLAGRNRNAFLSQQLFRLILVNVHAFSVCVVSFMP